MSPTNWLYLLKQTVDVPVSTNPTFTFQLHTLLGPASAQKLHNNTQAAISLKNHCWKSTSTKF